MSQNRTLSWRAIQICASLVFLQVAACGGGTDADDGGMSADADTPDADSTDAGSTDAAMSDGGPLDPDAGCVVGSEPLWYDDTDGDGLGDPAMSMASCEMPTGYVSNSDDLEPDCATNDTDRCDVCGGDESTCADCTGVMGGPANPDACEICSGGTSGHVADSDQDDCGVCFGPGETLYYADADMDSLGDPASTMGACELPTGYVENADDTEPLCMSNDTDECGVCAGVGQVPWYRDSDGDDLGDSSDFLVACLAPDGYVADNSDTQPTCRTNDEDACGMCAGTGGDTFYRDQDEDGLGDPAMSMQACTVPDGYVSNSSDVEPECITNNTDACGICAGPGEATWYRDQDSDLQGDSSMSMSACEQPTGYVDNSTDAQPECTTNDEDACGTCGGTGSGCTDCAGVVDGTASDDACGVCSGGTSEHEADSDRDTCGICFGSGETTYYADTDGDGQGDSAAPLQACSLPDGYVLNNSDPEPTCISNDTDSCGECGGTGPATWYGDGDSDGRGDPAVTTVACTQPAGYVEEGNDTRPGCTSNIVDSCGECDGPGELTWYGDSDMDGRGDPAVTALACTQPVGYVSEANDTQPACRTNDEVCGECGNPAMPTWYYDFDDDGQGDPTVTMLACTAPPNYVNNGSDTQPNCGTNDEVCGVCGNPAMPIWYDDTDNDNLGDPAITMSACTMPTGY